jgi:hypothetical protein
MDQKAKSLAIATLRKASLRWKPRQCAKVAARTARNCYTCQECRNTFPSRSVQLDHIEPVIPLDGWNGFDSFIERLFCGEEGFQVLCKECHKERTTIQNAQRKANRSK